MTNHLNAIRAGTVTKTNVIGLCKAINAHERRMAGLSVSCTAPTLSGQAIRVIEREIHDLEPRVVRISWELLTPRDDSADTPPERDDGFWPSLDPEEAGYIGDAAPDDVDGSKQRAEWERQHAAAEERLAAWERGDWEFVGVIARARIFIPIGNRSFRTMTIDSAGLWGIESDAGDYLREVFTEERAELLGQLRTLGQALGVEPSFVEEMPE